MSNQHEKWIKKSIEIAIQAVRNGNHPFGSLIVTQEGTILDWAENEVVTTQDVTRHSETLLITKVDFTMLIER